MNQHAGTTSAPSDLLEYIGSSDNAIKVVDQIDWTRLPRQIAVIMDGNGRWAQKQGLPRIVGHEYGVQCIQKVLETLEPMGVKFVTLYAFSTENWGRPQEEIDGIMDVFSEAVASQTAALHERTCASSTWEEPRTWMPTFGTGWLKPNV